MSHAPCFRSLLAACALLAPGPLLAGDTLPVRSVALFSSGVGYFQHAGEVAGGGEVTLPFKSSQINDVLKSLVVEEVDGVFQGFVVYPSRDPLSRILEGFQVNLTSDPTLAEVLRQLRGAVVRVEHQGDKVEGAVLGVEQRPVAVDGEGEPVVDWVLNLAGESGLRALPLREVNRLELKDPVLRKELEQALETLHQGRGKDKKPVVIHFPERGGHKARVGYVIESPVWKSSYRLLLGERSQPAMLQGWAIVENQTDNDWEGVRLSLVSGRPVSFVQDLYQPLYADRPDVPVTLHAGIKPRVHDAGLMAEAAPEADEDGAREVMEKRAERMPRAMPAPAMVMSMAGAAPAAPPPPPPWEQAPLDPARVTAAASAESLGTLFQYTVEGVTLPRQRAAMIPIVAGSVVVERVSLYNAAVLANHPMRGLWLANTTATPLPAGPVALFEGGGYAGDALLDDMPPGQKRLLTHAVDLEVTVLPPSEGVESRVTAGRIVHGVLFVSRKEQVDRLYALENGAKESRTVLVEHPFRAGWKLADTPVPEESTAKLHRFRRVIPAGARDNLRVREERVWEQEVALLPLAVEVLVNFQQEGEFAEPVKKAMEKIMALKRELVASERDLDENGHRVTFLRQDQERIQGNMKTIRPGTDYYERLLAKLNTQEGELERLQQQAESLRETLRKQQAGLEEYLVKLTIGG